MEAPTPSTACCPATATGAVQLWAEFTKAFSIYPPANHRVLEALERFREALTPAAEGRERVRIVFGATHCGVGDHRMEIGEGNLRAWLAQRIERAALAGLVFDTSVSADTLTAFTTQLLSHFTRRDFDLPFEALWPEAYPGLELVDRRFDGYFDDAMAGSGSDAGALGATQREDRKTSSTNAAVRRLAADTVICDGMQRIRELLDATSEEGEAHRSLDLAAQVVQLLPHDTAQDQEGAVEVARAVVEQIEKTLLGEGPDSEIARAFTDESMLNQLVHAASRTLLGSLAPDTEEAVAPTPDAPLARGRRGDDAVHEDVSELLGAMETLPPPCTAALRDDTVLSDADVLGVYAHYALQGDLAALGPSARADLARLLREPDPACTDVLREAVAGADAAGRTALLGFLRTGGMMRILRTAQVITPEQTIAEFPANFGLYLRAVSPHEPSDLDELDDVARTIGPAAVRRHASALVVEETVLGSHAVQVLLARPSPALRGFVRLLIERGDPAVREQAVAMLRKLCGREDEACLLYLWDRPAALPLDYLLKIADPELPPADRQALAPRISADIAQFLASTEGQDAEEDRRVQAIHLLGRFFGPHAQEVLRHLRGARRLGVLPKESKRIRDAIGVALTRARSGWEGTHDV